MTSYQELSNEIPKGGPTEAGPHPYDLWLKKQDVLVYRGYAVDDLKTLELGPWETKGGKGAVIRFHGSGYINDGQVVEIEPAKKLHPQKQLFEETVYVVSGRGATQFWYDETAKQTIEWQRHSLFAIPPNVNFQHMNTDSKHPARYYSSTTAPIMFDLFGNEDFIFNSNYRFLDRFVGPQKDYPTQFKSWSRNEFPPQVWETNFVSDISSFDKLGGFEGRGKGNRGVLFKLSNGRSRVHISEFPEGTYKKAHRHGPAANVIITAGKGYSLMWQGDKELKDVVGRAVRIDWHEDSVFVPPEMWWHQHFNTNKGLSRYMPIHATGTMTDRQEMGTQSPGHESGKNQIEYSEEDSGICRLFASELLKTGARLDPRMPCTS